MDNKEASSVELTFVPAWARKSPEKWVIPVNNPEQDTKSRRKKSRPGGAEKTDKRLFPQAREPRITVSFIPEVRGLKRLVKQLANTRRAYSVFEIASTFLSRPEFYASVITSSALDGQAALPLYQCLKCKAVFANKQLAFIHGLNRHMNLFYDQEKKECEPPKGKFSCVARCTLSGKLLGPPNYHEFSEKLLELHRACFADMPLWQYRKKIVNETDPALIEQWKKEAGHKTIYRSKLLNEEIVFKHISHLERHFNEHYAPGLIREGVRFVVPATVIRDMNDRSLSPLIHKAWEKETRFPINMASAIQKRFHRSGLHIFKTTTMTFASAVKPRPIDPKHSTDTIRNILEWVRTNTLKTRQNLVSELAPGTRPESAAVAEIINSLVWLIDRGHVIEFINGTLTVPDHALAGKEELKKQ